MFQKSKPGAGKMDPNADPKAKKPPFGKSKKPPVAGAPVNRLQAVIAALK